MSTLPAIRKSDAAASSSSSSNSSGGSSVQGEKDGLRSRISIVRLATAVVLGFTLAQFVREYMDIAVIRDREMSTTQEKRKTDPYVAGILPLQDLVRVNETVQCPHEELLPIQSVHNNIADAGNGRKIPKIVHVTGKTKCSTKGFVDGTISWTWPDHSFYFHDDQAVQQLLFARDWPEFPQLKNSWECLKYSGGAALADLWRYVAMWEYGGIYTDMDNLPGLFLNETTITPDIDAFFLQEKGGFLSQFFFAVSPKHPLMFLAVHDVMEQMHTADDWGKMYIPYVTGPGSTKRAFIRFMGGNSKTPQHLLDKWGYPDAGTWIGKFGANRSVTVVGTRKTGNNWVQRSALGGAKRQAWDLMNVSDYQKLNKQEKGQTCLGKLHDWHMEQRQQFVEDLHQWRW